VWRRHRIRWIEVATNTHLVSSWSPYTVGLVNKVESVQRRFTKRFVCCYSLTYSLRLTKLRIESLELRRLHLGLVYVYKILFGMVET